MEYARSIGKPVFVDFTGHGCVNCREMEVRVWSDSEVLDILRRDYVIIALYSDDKKVLPREEWITTASGRTLKSMGKKNSYLINSLYGVNAQPTYLLLSPQGRELLPPRGYNLDVEGYVEFLKNGIREYETNK
jgi:thiol:disulfide interchange protein DsbD